MATIGAIWGEIWDEAIWDTAIWEQATTAPPILTLAEVVPGGLSIRFHFSKPVTVGAGGNGGFALTASGGAATVSYSSGAGTAILTYTVNRALGPTEIVTVAYTQPTNGLEDLTGTDVDSFSGFTVSIFGSKGNRRRRNRILRRKTMWLEDALADASSLY